MKTSKHFAAFLLISFLSACGDGSITPISTLIAQARDYDMQKVSTQGTVGRTAGLLGVGIFEISDLDGAILYVVTDRGVPETKSVTTVSGTFKQVVKANNTSYDLIVENERIDLAKAIELLGLIL